ncbi:MAG: AAA family ATPase [Methylotenera sp.]|nr:AAA family ATPase [Methylotenera sp.]
MLTEGLFDELKRFETEYVQFPPFQNAFTEIENTLSLYRRTGIAHNFLVLGESGTGKSSLCRLINERYQRFSITECDVIPVLIVSVPPIVNLASLVEAMLKAIGHPFPSTGNLSQKTETFIKLAKACRVEMVLFDEAQHLQDRGQDKTHYMVGDWLKRLIDELQIPTVFLGLPRLELLLMVNEQLRRRFSRKLLLSLGQSQNVTIAQECLQLFMSLGDSLKVRLCTGEYGWDQMGTRLYYASDGRVAYIKKLIACALRMAMEMQLTEIGPQDLAIIFKENVWWEADGKLNPFHPDFVFRRLDRGNEPFETGRTI